MVSNDSYDKDKIKHVISLVCFNFFIHLWRILSSSIWYHNLNIKHKLSFDKKKTISIFWITQVNEPVSILF